jgi:hypothetical protein
MSRYPITYGDCEGSKYSPKGLKKLSPRLRNLNDFPFSVEAETLIAITAGYPSFFKQPQSIHKPPASFKFNSIL